MLKHKTQKKKDIILMILFPMIATAISLIFKTNFLISTLLFFGIPSIYLSYKNKKAIKKTLLFSIIFSIPLGIIIDYFAIKDKSWYVPNTVFSFRLLGIIPLEDLIWGFLLVYAIISFYEYFLDKKTKEKENKYLKHFAMALFSILIFLIILFFTYPSLTIPYFYFWSGLFLVLIPTILFLSFNPKFLPRYIKVSVYFFGLFFLFEITGLQLNQWEFPGENFIGSITLFKYQFPLEEFLFFISLISVAILSYYEFFADDKN